MPTQEPLVPYRAPGSTYDQFIGLKSRHLKERKLWIAQYIDDDACNSIISSLLYMQSESDKEDIKLFLNIPGANLRPALAIYDAVSELKADGCKIATTNIQQGSTSYLSISMVKAVVQERRVSPK